MAYDQTVTFPAATVRGAARPPDAADGASSGDDSDDDAVDFRINVDQTFLFETASAPLQQPTFLVGVEPLWPHSHVKYKFSVSGAEVVPNGGGAIGGPVSGGAIGGLPGSAAVFQEVPRMERETWSKGSRHGVYVGGPRSLLGIQPTNNAMISSLPTASGGATANNPNLNIARWRGKITLNPQSAQSSDLLQRASDVGIVEPLARI
jgi:hypothetical protein